MRFITVFLTPGALLINFIRIYILMKFINRAPGVRKTVINLIIVKNS